MLWSMVANDNATLEECFGPFPQKAVPFDIMLEHSVFLRKQDEERERERSRAEREAEQGRQRPN